MKTQNITIIGAGTMGAGIAAVAAQSGFQTLLNDMSIDLLAQAQERIAASWDKAISKGKLSESERKQAEKNLHVNESLEASVSSADLVIEAIPEKMSIKTEVFQNVVTNLAEHCILATNTSSLSVKELAESSGIAPRFIGMHFFNPPAALKLLEIVTHDQLNDQVLEEVKAVGQKLDRKSIVVKDSPGFASSRLGIAIAMEAIRMLEEGVASAEDIDTAMEVGYKHPMGPLKLTDHVGLDVRLNIAEYLHSKLGSENFNPPGLLKQMVSEGKLGRKSGQGFYSW